MLVPDRFDHFNRDQLVELTGQVAIVTLEKRDAVGQPGLLDACPRGSELCTRNRRGRDLAFVVFGGMQGESSPTAADFQHAIRGAQPELAAHAIELLNRGVIHRRFGSGKDAAGVRQGLVKPQAKKLVPQIVVRLNVAATPRTAIVAPPVE